MQVQNQHTKPAVFLYMNNIISEKEIKETISLTVASKTIKYLGINSFKEVKDMYTESCKSLIKEIEDTNKCKDIHVHQLQESIMLKCSYYLKPYIDSM